MDITAILDKANDVRLAQKQDTAPVDVDKICKNLGIKVSRSNLSGLEQKTKRKISGLIYVDPKTKEKNIYVNRNDAINRQRFTVAHELGHYFLHVHEDDNGIIVSFRGLKNQREYEADKFASELLMPEYLVEQEYRKLPFPTAGYLARIFRVSKLAMQYKLDEMELSTIG